MHAHLFQWGNETLESEFDSMPQGRGKLTFSINSGKQQHISIGADLADLERCLERLLESVRDEIVSRDEAAVTQ